MLIPRPSAACKVRAIICGRHSVPLVIIACWLPEVPLSFWVVYRRPTLLEPGMLVTSVIDHQIQDQLHVMLMTSCDQVLDIFYSTIWRVHILVVRYIVAHVYLR